MARAIQDFPDFIPFLQPYFFPSILCFFEWYSLKTLYKEYHSSEKRDYVNPQIISCPIPHNVIYTLFFFLFIDLMLQVQKGLLLVLLP